MSQNNAAYLSKYRVEYTALKGNSPFTTNGSGVFSVTITHNLGFIPYWRIYLNFNTETGYYVIFSGGSALLGVGGWRIDTYTASSTTITIAGSYLAGGVQSGTVYYRIYNESQS